jgi:hypothetical protein
MNSCGYLCALTPNNAFADLVKSKIEQIAANEDDGSNGRGAPIVTTRGPREKMRRIERQSGIRWITCSGPTYGLSGTADGALVKSDPETMRSRYAASVR